VPELWHSHISGANKSCIRLVAQSVKLGEKLSQSPAMIGDRKSTHVFHDDRLRTQQSSLTKEDLDACVVASTRLDCRSAAQTRPAAAGWAARKNVWQLLQGAGQLRAKSQLADDRQSVRVIGRVGPRRLLISLEGREYLRAGTMQPDAKAARSRKEIDGGYQGADFVFGSTAWPPPLAVYWSLRSRTDA
jgi:hypothetical protein